MSPLENYSKLRLPELRDFIDSIEEQTNKLANVPLGT